MSWFWFNFLELFYTEILLYLKCDIAIKERAWIAEQNIQGNNVGVRYGPLSNT